VWHVLVLSVVVLAAGAVATAVILLLVGDQPGVGRGSIGRWVAVGAAVAGSLLVLEWLGVH